MKQRLLIHSSSCKSIWYMPTLKLVTQKPHTARALLLLLIVWFCEAVNSWDSSGKGLFWGTVLAVVPEETEQNYRKCTADKQ